MLYCPVPSATTERVFSINAGLEASTVTPGSSAPEASLTTPAMDPCACASVEKRRRTATTNDPSQSGFMLPPAEVAKGPRDQCGKRRLVSADATTACRGLQGESTLLRNANSTACRANAHFWIAAIFDFASDRHDDSGQIMISANFADVATWMCVADLRLFVTLRSIALLGACVWLAACGSHRSASRTGPPPRENHADEPEWFADAPRRLLRAS